MKVYDFDKTIYDGDSTVDFYLYSVKKNPLILLCLPYQAYAAMLYKLKIINKTQMKQRFYIFLKFIKNIDSEIENFWKKNIVKIKKWYKKEDNDVIISASPEFLLAPVCSILQIKHLMASKVDKKTGIYWGLNCYGDEKVKRFREKFENAKIDEFYSDSLSDSPLALISEKSFFVNKDNLSDWKF